MSLPNPAPLSLDAVADASIVLPQASASPGKAATPAAPIVAQLAEPLKPAAATLAELEAACPGASNDFLVAQLKASATREQAVAARMQQLAAENAELRTKAAAQPAAAAAPEPKKPGAAPVPAAAAAATQTAAGGDALAQFEEAVAEEMQATKKPRHECVQAVCRRDPDMREAMVAAHNAQHAAARKRGREKASA